MSGVDAAAFWVVFVLLIAGALYVAAGGRLPGDDD